MAILLAPDAEELVRTYLRPHLDNVSVEMPANPPMPFYLINRISGGDDMITEYPVVQVDCFNTTRTGASDAARALHGLMKQLDAKVSISVGGVTASIDSIEVVEAPHWEDYGDDNLQRYCGRYRLDLRLKTTT